MNKLCVNHKLVVGLPGFCNTTFNCANIQTQKCFQNAFSFNCVSEIFAAPLQPCNNQPPCWLILALCYLLLFLLLGLLLLLLYVYSFVVSFVV